MFAFLKPNRDSGRGWNSWGAAMKAPLTLTTVVIQPNPDEMAGILRAIERGWAALKLDMNLDVEVNDLEQAA